MAQLAEKFLLQLGLLNRGDFTLFGKTINWVITMHHSLKRKILDLNRIESIVEDITAVEAEKIVGGTLSVSASQVVPEKIVKGKPSESVKPSLLAKLNDDSVKKLKILVILVTNITSLCQPPMLDPLCPSL